MMVEDAESPNTVEFPSGRIEQLRLLSCVVPVPARPKGSVATTGLALTVMTPTDIVVLGSSNARQQMTAEYNTRNLPSWGPWEVMDVTASTEWVIPIHGTSVEELEDGGWELLKVHSHNYGFLMNSIGRTVMPMINQCVWIWNYATDPLVRRCHMRFSPRRVASTLR